MSIQITHVKCPDIHPLADLRVNHALCSVVENFFNFFPTSSCNGPPPTHQRGDKTPNHIHLQLTLCAFATKFSPACTASRYSLGLDHQQIKDGQSQTCHQSHAHNSSSIFPSPLAFNSPIHIQIKQPWRYTTLPKSNIKKNTHSYSHILP